MKVKTNTLGELLFPLRQYFQKDNFARQEVNKNSPFRSELFSIEQLEQHARQLARTHQLSYEQAPEQLLKRLDQNEEILFRVNTLLQNAVKEKTPIMPAGEWLLDNFYLIEEQIRTGKRYLPKGYSKGLPKLSSGDNAGLPRVYDIVLEIISHSDGHVDMQRLSSFVNAYQEESHLTLGELWAVPIMLRLALLENLRRVAARIGVDRIDADLAHHWADQIITTAEKDPKNLVLVIADMSKAEPPMVSAFVAEFARKLQWKGPSLTFALTWVEQHLAESGLTIASLVLAENQKQAADQVSMSNSINSLRFLAKMDWREFVETMSVVEQTLRKDLSGIYGHMDFYTRDHYRHQVERMAKRSRLPENDVAALAIQLASDSFQSEPDNGRKSHVGYYLIAEGVPSLEKLIKPRLTFGQYLVKFSHKNSYALYVIGSTLITLALTFGLIAFAHGDHLPLHWMILLGVLGMLGASHFAFAVINWIATLRVKPSPLPRMNYAKGIAEEELTMVVVPTIIANQEQAMKLIEDLEVRFLSNRDPNLLFALLTDFKDATAEHTPEDDKLVDIVKTQIEQLNTRYGRTSNDTFFLFHRPRQWNAGEKTWMGYERKRGKLAELNHVLRNSGSNRFSVIVGDEKIYRHVRYIITLDTDTQLPRESAWKLVGMMAHPLNRPVYDAVTKTIKKGYGIIQPRIAISLHGATRSLFTRMNENDAGIDPYTRVTSDVYQDIFKEGSFIGKGIYDVDAFEKVLHNRFPENRILSHDLLEGSYVRCGFASDVQLYEEYPSRYYEDIMRRHRWIRGDWQIGNWFLPYVPNEKGKLVKNSISALSRWKIFDNLRRSLVPVALTLMLLLSWTSLPSAWFWTTVVLSIIVLPSLMISFWNIIHKPEEIDFSTHVKNSLKATNRTIVQAGFSLICLPYEAFISVDAIFRTLWRMFISHHRLLQWNPSGLVQKKYTSLFSVYVRMWVNPVIFVTMFTYLFVNAPASLQIAVPFLILWIASPTVVWWLSLPQPSSKTKLTADQKIFLRSVARKTWLFFENVIGPDDNWLPPDNLQEYPIPVVAHRTSPTNMGISLLANLTAYDFGYATQGQMLARTKNTVETMCRMERYMGHFYNWYDTQSLNTLSPKYISAVDSGNLAGHMLTMRQGLIALLDQKIFGDQLWCGLLDTARQVEHEVTSTEKKNWKSLHEKFEHHANFPPVDLAGVSLTLADLDKEYKQWLATAPKTNAAKVSWTSALEQQLKAAIEEFNLFTPCAETETAPERFKSMKIISGIPTLHELARMDRWFSEEFPTDTTPVTPQEKDWLVKFETCVKAASARGRERVATISYLTEKCADFSEMDYSFLYDKSLRLMSIGYSVDAHHRDSAFYDLLASEARLGLFVAIGQGKIPQESWFMLGRRLGAADGTPVLLSWSATMFEYLMPMLVMPTYDNTLLDETCHGVVKRQIEYGRQQSVPWGISESCYNIVDAGLNYQYKAFGVPGLGFKRGLGQDLVIAPYATVMALMVDPAAACENLEVMHSKGFLGDYGFYEAIDYTSARLPRGQTHVVIQTFMVHHQAMSLLSLSYLLLDQPMQKRFESDAQLQTALLLLQEQVPKTTGFYSATSDDEQLNHVSANAEMRVITTPDTPVPEVQLLSNGRYHVMITNAGGGYSRWKDIAVNRWREDTTRDNRGTFCYLRNLESGELWSSTYQPVLKRPLSYEVIFSQGRAEFRRVDNEVETYTEIIVSPEDDIEIRRIHITNHSKTKRKIEITSYAEVVLDLPGGDSSHPAFGNLFVQTEIIRQQQAILCTRRARAHDEKPPFMLHLMKVNGAEPEMVSYETDRNKFIGRGNTVSNPEALTKKEPLSDSDGSVLDPIVSIQSRITVLSEQTISIDIISGVAETREATQALLDKYHDRHLRNRAFELSWTHSQVVLRQINASESEAQLYGRLASSVIYANPALRATSDVLMKNQKGQSGLWSYSISGDLPIVLLQISDTSNITLVKQMMQARAYWQLKGLMADLVIINEDHSGYRQLLQDEIQGMVAAGININTASKQGGVFVRSADQIPTEDYILMQTVARVIISDKRGSLEDQINKRFASKLNLPYLPSSTHYPLREKTALPSNLLFYNGFGGFTEDGKEYVVGIDENTTTPVPWINVIANKNFGTIISESGSSYTWAENAHEFRLTPWENDPVSDGSGEAFFVRDEETGFFWSPLPLPRKGNGLYVVRHGFGYSTFEHSEDGIITIVTQYVDQESAIKFISINVKNNSGRTRKLSATGYTEWVLGGERPKSAMHIVTDLDATTGSLIARNPYSSEFSNRAVFLDVDDAVHTFTTDRTEFLGRNGSLKSPDAMKRQRLSGRLSAGLDPCAAFQVPFELPNGAQREIIFKLGAGKDIQEARETILKFRGKPAAQQSLARVKAFWEDMLGSIRIETPDNALNILTNGWLLYQVVSCRLWGRSGFYQSGGAFGFRDQLQDVLSLLHAQPQMTRDQILLSASRQFKEGDVQHWWHPPLGRGVRTLCSDDFLWLPFATSRYILATGDTGIAHEVVPFIEGRRLNDKEESYYDLPVISLEKGTLYDHCKRSIRHALRFGENGLPFMGSGDWNDGMNLVGIQGKGESVWLAFFLYDILVRFVKIASLQQDPIFENECKVQAEKLKNNIQKNAWDGKWYVRAFFDDGKPLGSSKNKECRIDSISQSWSVLSDGGEPSRSLSGMQAVDDQLVDRQHKLIRLLDPPFNNTEEDPGYIKGYVPGVRENGGQYTHAAVWMIMAFAKMGNRARTWELLQMINPISHGSNENDIKLYKAEPYVMAADVYGAAPHEGRGGWTWYTGSAGWTYQLILESFLGLQRDGNRLKITPCVPVEWPSFKIHYRYHQTFYAIEVASLGVDEERVLSVDGVEQKEGFIELKDDQMPHIVKVGQRSNINASVV